MLETLSSLYEKRDKKVNRLGGDLLHSRVDGKNEEKIQFEVKHDKNFIFQ